MSVFSDLRLVVCALLWLGIVAPVAAQAPQQPAPPPPPAASAAPAAAPVAADLAKAIVGAWELSNADRDLRCAVTFRLAPARPGLALDFDKACATVFPITKDVAAWTLGKNDAIQFLDAKGRILLELTELETGLYEGLRPGDPLYFLQSQAALGGERTVEQMKGEWAIARAAGRPPLCRLTLSADAAGPEAYALTLRPGCDPSIAAFQPRAWQLDRGQLVIFSARGEAWRFEEGDTEAWQRIPAGRQPLVIVKQ